MTHDEARMTLEAVALDALDQFERAVVLAHVAECADCAAELGSLRRSAAQLAFVAAPIAMSPEQRERIRARLLARAKAEPGRTAASVSQPASPTASPVADRSVVPIGDAPSLRASVPRRRLTGSGWLALAASTIAVLSVGTLLGVQRDRDALRASLRTAATDQGMRRVALDSLRATLADRERLIANLTGPGVAVMTLASTDPRSPAGRMFWDQQHNAWTFVAHNLQKPKAGRAYQLWLVTTTAKISAGTFAPGATGDAVVRATYALDPKVLAAVAVTDEPDGGSAQPTTAPLLLASNR